MKSEVARYIYEKRLCPSILLLVSLSRRLPDRGMGMCGMSWNEELELEMTPYFFDHHDIPSRSRLMEINFRTSPEIKLPTTAFSCLRTVDIQDLEVISAMFDGAIRS
jgi:hypothetical protein